MKLDIKKEMERQKRKKRNKKYLQISMILEELEERYRVPIKEFTFKDNWLGARVNAKGEDWVYVNLNNDIEDISYD